MTGRPSGSSAAFWLLFSAGGTASAMLLPAMVFATGIAVPAGWVSESELLALVRNPWTRVVLAGLVLIFLFHWAHRFRYALVDLGLKRLGEQAWFFYGIASFGGILAAVAAIRM